MLTNKKGFSLLEMAIVLVIFGLILSSASGIVSMFVNMGKSERSRERIQSNKDALISIAAEDGYLQDTDVGIKSANVSLSYPLDVFDRDFQVYLADEIKYTELNDELDFRPVCGTKSTTLQLNICTNTDCSSFTSVPNIAFVIVSGYEDRNIQTNTVANVVDVYEQGSAFDVFAGDGTNATDYDDIVDWTTLSELRSKAGCDAERLTIKDADIPVIESGDDFSFNLFPEGGVPFPQAGASTVEEYYFELTEDGGLDSNVTVQFVRNGSATALTVGGGSQNGEFLRVRSNNTGLGNSSYRVKIQITDNGGNTTDRTLYIKTMD